MAGRDVSQGPVGSRFNPLHGAWVFQGRKRLLGFSQKLTVSIPFTGLGSFKGILSTTRLSSRICVSIPFTGLGSFKAQAVCAAFKVDLFQSPSRGLGLSRKRAGEYDVLQNKVSIPFTGLGSFKGEKWTQLQSGLLKFQSPSRGLGLSRSRIKTSSQLSLAIFYLIITLDCTNAANASRLNDILVPFDGKSCRSYAYEALEFTRFLHSTLLRTFCEQYSHIM